MGKMPETIKFQALGIIESKTVCETVLAWAQKLKSEGAQYELNTGCGLCQKAQNTLVLNPRHSSWLNSSLTF